MFDQVRAFHGLPATIITTTGAKVLGIVDAAGASFFNLPADTIGDTASLRSTLDGGYRLAYADVASIA